MITLNISDETLKAAFDKHLEKLFTPGDYNNPVKSVIDSIFGWNSKEVELKAELDKQIKQFMIEYMASPKFGEDLGKAIAGEMAKRELDKMKK